MLRERRLRKEGEGEAADAWGLRVRPLTRGACGSASVRAGEAGERGTAGEVGAGVRAAGPERVQREVGRTGPSAGLLRVGVEMGRTCGVLCWARARELGRAACGAGRGATRGEGWAAGREAGPVRVSAWERVGLLASRPGKRVG